VCGSVYAASSGSQIEAPGFAGESSHCPVRAGTSLKRMAGVCLIEGDG